MTINLLLPFLGFFGLLSAENSLGGYCVVQSRHRENGDSRLVWIIKW